MTKILLFDLFELLFGDGRPFYFWFYFLEDIMFFWIVFYVLSSILRLLVQTIPINIT